MLQTVNTLKEKYKEYSNINTKIQRDISSGKLFRLKKGLYETNRNLNGYLLANAIYGPSYLSFDYALSYYGMIPERVVNYTSATYDKKKKREYTNVFGTYYYRDIPKEAYPYGVAIITEGDYTYHIATKEKALCDKLYILNPVHSINELEELLFNDLRLDIDVFKTLNIKDIEFLSEKYHTTNIYYLLKYMKGVNNE